MVHRCCISSCGMNVRVAEAKGLSYHGFPNKEPLREQWIQAIIPHLDKPEAFRVVPRYTRVCSRHFRKRDYSVDIKKRARLNSNAVPSVFPRKNSPVIVPNVLSSPTKGNKEKGKGGEVTGTSLEGTLGNTSSIILSSEDPSTSNSFCNVSWASEGVEGAVGGERVSISSSTSREYVIESATLTDDQLTLTVRDSVSSLEDLAQSPSNLNTNEDSNEAPQKKRKRRKWNRSAFDRPAKGQRKGGSSSSNDVNIDGVGEALAEISLSTLLAISTPDLQNKFKISTSNGTATTTTVPGTSEGTGTTCLQTVSLPLDKSTVQNMPPDQVQHLSSIEQELMQSIQAVSLHCGPEPDINKEDAILDNHNSKLFTIGKTPAFTHHSSQESLFSTEDESISISGIDKCNIKLEYHPTETVTSSSPTDAGLLSQFVGVDRGPTLLEIENLANHFNNSLLTGYNPAISLSIGLEDLHLPSTEGTEKETPSTSTASASSSLDDIQNQTTIHVEVPEQGSQQEDSDATGSPSKSGTTNRRKKKSDNTRLSGVTKKHKKEKIFGQFSVERFMNSDKDIEYYTGFSSYRNFEAFFRSLEAYVERLRVTDVMYGVTNLDKLHSTDASESSEYNSTADSSDSEFVSPLPPPPALDEPQKKRPFHGRSMSRIDELFMTIIRLRRKLPEKVLGHMFCISQPTVSRIIRAWTVLLSKLIDCYPVESPDKSKSSKGLKSEHSYTSRGLGIPESFRLLFHSELAQSIVVTSVSPKGKKPIFKPPFSTSFTSIAGAKRPKKSRLEESDTSRISAASESLNTLSSSVVTNTLDPSTNPVCDLLTPTSNLLIDSLGDDLFPLPPVGFLD